MSGDLVDRAKDALRRSHRRMTPQRELVLNTLYRSHTHLDAEAIWEQARQEDASVDLATVYRTLSVLKDMGLVDQRYFAREHKRELYEPLGKAEHHHFTCTACGKVIEFHTDRIQALHEDLRDTGLSPARTCVCIEGHCRACSRKDRSEERGR